MKVKKLEKKDLVRFAGLFNLFFLFSTTFAIGILTALELTKFPQAFGEQMPPISFWQFILNFAFAICLMGVILFLQKKLKKQSKILLTALFLITVAMGSIISLGVFIGDFAFLVIAVLIFIWFKKPNVLLQNVLMVLGMAGAGSYLGVRLVPETVVLMLIVFSVYDYIAVYKTKHMVKMAKQMMEQGAILGLILPQNISDFVASLKQVQPGGKRFFILGGGDIVFPLIFSVSLLSKGLTQAIIVAVFSLIGLFANIYFFDKQKARKPIPALPLIALFSIIGFLITLIIQ